MKANELMVGDWVYVAHNGKASHFGKVTSLLSSGAVETEIDGSFALSSSVDSIPITPEILEKNGFTNYGESWYIANAKDCVMIGFHMYETTINVSKDRISFYKSIPCEYRSCYSNRKVFVHELQHTLRLCRIDKEIVV